MTRDTITTLPDPNGFSADPLTDLIRSGARKLIEQALEAELSALLAEFSTETTPEGHARGVRHGHLPEREVIIGGGPVAVQVPRVRDRGDQAEKVRFTSSILPSYLRKAQSVEQLLPWLYLKGISTGDFQEALAALLGPNAAGLSSTTISRFKADWWEDYGATAEQRCWFHKAGNVLNAMPKSLQAKTRGHLHDIWQAETKAEANTAFDFFVETYGVTYEKAVTKRVKDRDVLLAFYDFPAEHWKHIRTTHPIESTFATVRHRTGKPRAASVAKPALPWPSN